MQKALGYILLIVFTTVYVVSLSSKLTQKIIDRRLYKPPPMLQSDMYRYGDLYGLCYLPQYRMPVKKTSTIPLYKSNTSGINLYTICDSYLRIYLPQQSLYCGVDTMFFAKINGHEKLTTPLDPQKQNILLLEIAERNLRTTLRNASNVNNLISVKGQQQHLLHADSQKTSLFSNLSSFLFNKSINANIELNIWDFFFETPIKEFKAFLNLKLFNVVDQNVVVSPDEKYLLYKPTIDTTLVTSSFQHIPDTEIKSIVDNLNQIYADCRNAGFNKIYLAVIPNPVSILFPNYKGLQYNQLVTRVQNSGNLKMQVVDIFSIFKISPIPVYSTSDSHWNMDGAYIWLNKFNKMLSGQESTR